MNFLLYLTFVLFLLIALVLVLLVLIQKGRGGGLASAFGGGGGNTAFGSKTGDVLTWATSIVFGVFLVLAIALNLIVNATDAGRRAAATGANPPAAQTPAEKPAGPTAPAQGGETSLPQVPAGATDPGAAPVETTK